MTHIAFDSLRIQPLLQQTSPAADAFQISGNLFSLEKLSAEARTKRIEADTERGEISVDLATRPVIGRHLPLRKTEEFLSSTFGIRDEEAAEELRLLFRSVKVKSLELKFAHNHGKEGGAIRIPKEEFAPFRQAVLSEIEHFVSKYNPGLSDAEFDEKVNSTLRFFSNDDRLFFLMRFITDSRGYYLVHPAWREEVAQRIILRPPEEIAGFLAGYAMAYKKEGGAVLQDVSVASIAKQLMDYFAGIFDAERNPKALAKFVEAYHMVTSLRFEKAPEPAREEPHEAAAPQPQPAPAESAFSRRFNFAPLFVAYEQNALPPEEAGRLLAQLAMPTEHAQGAAAPRPISISALMQLMDFFILSANRTEYPALYNKLLEAYKTYHSTAGSETRPQPPQEADKLLSQLGNNAPPFFVLHSDVKPVPNRAQAVRQAPQTRGAVNLRVA